MNPNRLLRVPLKLMLLFFGLFLFFNLNFLAGVILTDNMTIETHEIVDAPSKLVGTSRVLATSLANSLLIKFAPEGSFLKMLSGKEIFAISHLYKHVAQMKANGINKYLILAEPISLAFVVLLLSDQARDIGSVGFIKPTSYFEGLQVLLMRRRLKKEQKQFINSRVDDLFEFGLQPAFTSKLTETLMHRARANVEIYQNLDDLVCDASKNLLGDASKKSTKNVKLENIKNLFLLFGGFLVFVLSVFIVEVLLFKQLLTFKLVRYFDK